MRIVLHIPATAVSPYKRSISEPIPLALAAAFGSHTLVILTSRDRFSSAALVASLSPVRILSAPRRRTSSDLSSPVSAWPLLLEPGRVQLETPWPMSQSRHRQGIPLRSGFSVSRQPPCLAIDIVFMLINGHGKDLNGFVPQSACPHHCIWGPFSYPGQTAPCSIRSVQRTLLPTRPCTSLHTDQNSPRPCVISGPASCFPER